MMSADARTRLPVAMVEPTDVPDPAEAAEAEVFASSMERPKRTLFRRRAADATSPDETGVIPVVEAKPASKSLFRSASAVQPEGDSQETQVIAAVAGEGDTSGEVEGPDAPQSGARAKLQRERRELVIARQDSVYHLGGLAFELHRREQLPTPVMRLRAAEVEGIDDRVRQIDASLGDIDRQREDRKRVQREAKAARREVEVPPVGICAECGTGFPGAANFCANCGAGIPVVEKTAPEGPAVQAESAPQGPS